MAIKNIILYPEEETALRRKSEPVRAINRQIKNLIKDLKDTLCDHPEGIGLAAPQINVPKRIVVVRLSQAGGPEKNREPGPPVALVNPEIVEAGRDQRDFDGCLSLPGLYAETVRPHYLKVTGQDEWGKPAEWVFEDFDAVLVHHEIDHLEGILFIDRVEKIEDMYRVRRDENGTLVRVPLKIETEGKE